MKQTAVEWLQQINSYRELDKFDFEQAKEMEKEQMLNFADKVSLERINESIYRPFNIEQYYNHTYKSEQ